MSLDQRCQKFHEAALGTSKSKGPVKEVATLRNFLHKNQDQRFTDKAASRIFDTVQIYVVQQQQQQLQVDTETKEGLLEDCLKMPFTVFNTKQKQKMIKWLEDLRGGGAAISSNTTSSTSLLSVIDISDAALSLMDNESGDTYDVSLLTSTSSSAEATVDANLLVRIKEQFETTDNAVSVKCEMEQQSKGSVGTASEVAKILGLVTDQ